jgi:hypothetical protein
MEKCLEDSFKWKSVRKLFFSLMEKCVKDFLNVKVSVEDSSMEKCLTVEDCPF